MNPDRYRWTETTRSLCARWFPAVCTETETAAPGEVVSHRMCSECAAAYTAELRKVTK